MLSEAKKIAVLAGKRLLKHYSKQCFRVRYKSSFEPTTNLDLETESFLVKRIQKRFPAHSILSEEGATVKQKSDFQWVLDPLDGTINFSRGFPYFCVSIAVLKKNRPFIGVVYNPCTKELFSAQKGKGAFRNNQRIRVSGTKEIGKAVLSTGFSYRRGAEFSHALSVFNRLLPKAQVVRRTGSAALDLCQVAQGVFDGFFMLNTKLWDIQAGACIVSEAGGKVWIKKNSRTEMDIVATNSRLHKAIQKRVKARWAKKR